MSHHAATCKGSVGAVRCHNRLRHILYHELTSPAVSLTVFRARVYAADLHKSPAEQRALDLFINDPLFAPTARGLDVTIVSPHSAPYRNLADGDVSALAEHRKREYYAIPCEAEGIELLPVAIDKYGQSGPAGLQALQDLSNFAADRRGNHPLSEFRNLKTRVLASVLPYTAVMLNYRNCANTPPPDLQTGLVR